jgi:hypothetical protein
MYIKNTSMEIEIVRLLNLNTSDQFIAVAPLVGVTGKNCVGVSRNE